MITMSQDGDNNNNNNKNNREDLHEHDMVMPGFRFHPTEEELIEFYLRRKIEGKRFNVDLIAFLDLYRYDPWELPALAAIGEKEWYFYVPRDRKYRNGDRPNRVTTSGYWKATGADRLIKNETLKPIGLKKTLVFYSGKAPRGIRTSWIMNEYRLPHHETELLQKAEISLCRVYKRPGVEDHRPTTAMSRAPLGKAASSSSKTIPHNLDIKPTSQSDVVMNSSCGQIDEAEKLMSTETSASSSTDIGSGIISHAKNNDNNNNVASYDIINPFLQIPSLPHGNTSSFFSILGCNNMNPVIPHHQSHYNNAIQFEDLQMMPASYQQGYLNQHQHQHQHQPQQSLLGLNMAPNSSFWDQWTSSSNSVLHGSDQGSSSKGYINSANPFRNERSTY